MTGPDQLDVGCPLLVGGAVGPLEGDEAVPGVEVARCAVGLEDPEADAVGVLVTELVELFALVGAGSSSMRAATAQVPPPSTAMTAATAGDITARMALVPRTLEARGLDATPPMQARLRKAGDLRAVAILDVILRDEIGHVAVGNHWYRWLCQRDGLDPVLHYAVLAQRHGAPRPRPPFNEPARRAAGFSAAEIAALHTP